MKKLPISQFRALGLLQEINRRLLHPAGLALSIVSDGKDDGLSFEAQVLDARDDPEGFGFTFGDGGVDIETAAAKAARFDALVADHFHARLKEFGALIQPVPGRTDANPVALSTDDATVAAVTRIVSEALAAAGYEDATAEDCGASTVAIYEAIVFRIIAPLIAELRILDGSTLAVVPPPPVARAETTLSNTELARARWLARELRRLAADHDVHGGISVNGDLVKRTAPTELLGLEVEEALALASAVDAWPLDAPPPDARPAFTRMEELFALAQPGMAFWRGQRQDLLNSADIIHAKMAEYRASRTELERFLAGDISVVELTNPNEVCRALEARAAPLREVVKTLDDERAAAASALAPVDNAIRRLNALKFFNDACERTAGHTGPITAGG